MRRLILKALIGILGGQAIGYTIRLILEKSTEDRRMIDKIIVYTVGGIGAYILGGKWAELVWDKTDELLGVEESKNEEEEAI